MRIHATLLIAILLAACGGTNRPANTEPAGNTGGSSGFGDEHGKTSKVGDAELGGGYKVSLSKVESELKSEGIFELTVLKDGKATSDANVEIWLGNEEGFEFTPIAGCMWMDDQKVYDCHVQIPPDGAPEGARVWIRLRHESFDQRTDFPFTQ